MEPLQLIEAAVSYTKEGAAGEVKKVTEKYLVDAVSFSEAERKVIDAVSPYQLGEDLQVSAVKKTKYAEIILDPQMGEYWYEVKANIITVDEVTAQEKKTAFKTLVQCGHSIREALDKFEAVMANSVSDIEIVGIAETPILEVIALKNNI